MWTETLVTWNNQPTSAWMSYVSLPGETIPTLDYLDTDVTGIVQSMSTGHNFGFLLRLVNESATNIIAFCSKDHPNPSKRPRLHVTYHTPTGINKTSEAHMVISCFPDPAKDQVNFNSNSALSGHVNISVYNTLGQVIKGQNFENTGTGKLTMDIADLEAGLYLFLSDLRH